MLRNSRLVLQVSARIGVYLEVKFHHLSGFCYLVLSIAVNDVIPKWCQISDKLGRYGILMGAQCMAQCHTIEYCTCTGGGQKSPDTATESTIYCKPEINHKNF
jgi:hypothetical protein